MFAQFKQLTWKACLLAGTFSLLAFTVALAASGDLDTTFDGDGRVTSFAVPSNPGRSDIAWGIAIQPDGKILAAGYSFPTFENSDFAVIRYNADGSLDPTFSGDGRLITNFGGGDSAFHVAVQPNGKIVVVGEACAAPSTIGGCDAALARYNTNGTLDTTFSEDGKQTSDFDGVWNTSRSIAIQSNGKIVLVGEVDNDFAVYRYLSNGTLDTGFSGDGKVRIGFGMGRWDLAVDLAIQSDGKIVVAGFTGAEAYAGSDFAVVRLNKNGTLDTTFSGDGKLTTNFGADDFVGGLALQTDGKIVVAGKKASDVTLPQKRFALARYNMDGTLDTTFNGTGRKTLSIVAGVDSEANDVVIQSDGKIVVVGTSYNDSGINFIDFALVRLNSNGSLDSAFSGDGKITVGFGGHDYGHAVALQPSDGKYVMGGITLQAGQYDFAFARVLP